MKNDFSDFRYECLDGLDSEELLSAAKSNQMPAVIRREIKAKAAFTNILELIPTVASVIIGAEVMKCVLRVINDETRKK